MVYLVLLEKLSRKKILIFVTILFIVQIVYFLTGGLIATKPNHAANHEFSLCQAQSYIPWVYQSPKSNCRDDTLEFGVRKTWKDFVYVIQLPRITPWFQTLTSIIVPDIEYDPRISLNSNATLIYDVRLGYKTDEMFDDPNSQWILEAQSRESRSVQCHPIYHHGIEEKTTPDAFSCEPLAFLELSTLKYPHYLINLQIVDRDGASQNIGKLRTFEFVGIYQTEMFTQVWFILKTITFPIVFAALIWFCRQMKRSQRFYSPLDKLLFLLGLSATLLNMPIDWFTLIVPVPGFQIYSEIRQGFFLTVLLTFWLCFAGEHMMDKSKSHGFWSYGKYISLLWFSSGVLLIFEICQRGFQLWNPFHSIWSTRAGRYASFTFLILAGLSSFIYLIALIILVGQIFWNIRSKQRELTAMHRIRRLMYQGAFYRFQFLLLATIFCALMTMIWYFLSHIYETEWIWDSENRPKIHYSGAFITGIYGMMNIYTFAVLILFSPIHSNVDDMDALTLNEEDNNAIHLTNNQPSAYQMITKAAIS